MVQKPVQGSSIPTAFSMLYCYWILVTDQQYNKQEPFFCAITYMEAALPREGDSRGLRVFDPVLRGVPEVHGKELIFLGKMQGQDGRQMASTPSQRSHWTGEGKRASSNPIMLAQPVLLSWDGLSPGFLCQAAPAPPPLVQDVLFLLLSSPQLFMSFMRHFKVYF